MSNFMEQARKVANSENLKETGKFIFKTTRNALLIGFTYQTLNVLRLYAQGKVNCSNEEVFKNLKKFKTFVKDIKLDKI